MQVCYCTFCSCYDFQATGKFLCFTLKPNLKTNMQKSLIAYREKGQCSGENDSLPINVASWAQIPTHCHGRQGWRRWEHLSPTNVVQIWFPVAVAYVGQVCYWFTILALRIFLWVLQFFSHFTFPSSNLIGKQWKYMYACRSHIVRACTSWIPLKFLVI